MKKLKKYYTFYAPPVLLVFFLLGLEVQKNIVSNFVFSSYVLMVLLGIVFLFSRDDDPQKTSLLFKARVFVAWLFYFLVTIFMISTGV